MSHRFFLALALVLPLSAQDGGQLYTLYCSACHGTNGEGATAGTFPPLAGSPWVSGDPDRAIKVILNGLQGPMELLGKSYNLEMPPQGAVLSDEQIAAILGYVRSSWGNPGGSVSTDQVKSVRATVADRNKLWSVEEILKIHPLPLEKTALTKLISQTYELKSDWLPDLSKLTPKNVEEEHDGIISLKDSLYQDYFAMAWQGDFNVPTDGTYEFLLDADDAANLMVDSKRVVKVEGSGPLNSGSSRTGKIALAKGNHIMRVEYMEKAGEQGIVLGWRGPGEKPWHWLTEEHAKRESPEPIDIAPTDGRPVIYRNFIDGTTPRAIGVGFPGGLNLAWSADHLGPELIWTGKFIDGSARWLERGTTTSPPDGDDVVQLFKTKVLPENSRFKGYTLNSDGNPTFNISIGQQNLSDFWQAGEGKTLIRTLTLTGGTESMDYLLTNLPTDPSLMFGAPTVPVEISHHKAQVKLVPGVATTVTYQWK